MQQKEIFSAVKIENFIGFFIYIFAQNIDCGYTLEPPPSFFYIKVGFKGVYISWTCIPDKSDSENIYQTEFKEELHRHFSIKHKTKTKHN